MQEVISAIIIAVIQGLTEWLPVSSSGHLVLFQHILGFNPGISFDVALHFGTLLAVVVFFWKDLVFILKDFLTLNTKGEHFKLGVLLIIATIPAAIVGYFFQSFFENAFSSLFYVALGFLLSGILLFIAAHIPNGGARNKLKIKDSLIVGFAQIFALFPGLSRSGTTISSGIFSGLNEKSAARFSFLMAIPITLGANILTFNTSLLNYSVFWPVFISFIVGVSTLSFLFRVVLSSKKNLQWFAIYLFILSLSILLLIALNIL